MSTLPLCSLQTSILISRAAVSSSLSNGIEMSQCNQFSRSKTPEDRKEVTSTAAYYVQGAVLAASGTFTAGPHNNTGRWRIQAHRCHMVPTEARWGGFP